MPFLDVERISAFGAAAAAVAAGLAASSDGQSMTAEAEHEVALAATRWEEMVEEQEAMQAPIKANEKDLGEQNKAAQKEIATLKSEIEALRETIQGFFGPELVEKKEMKVLVKSLADEYDMHSLKLLEKTNQVLDLQDRVKALEERNDAIIATAKKEISELRYENAEFKAEVCKNEMALGEQLSAQDTEILRLALENQQLGARLASEKTSIESRVAGGQKILEQQSRITALEEVQNSLRSQNKTMNNTLRNCNAHEQKLVAELKERRLRIEELVKRVDDREGQVAVLTTTTEQQAEQIRWAEDTMFRSKAEYKKLKKEHDAIRKRTSKIKSKAEKLTADNETEIASLRQAKENLATKHKSLQDQIAVQEDSLRENGVEMAELLVKYKVTNETIQAIDATNKLVGEDIKTHQTQMGVRLAGLAQNGEQLQAQLSEKESLIAELETQIVNQEQRIAGEELEIASLSAEKFALQVDLTKALKAVGEAEDTMALVGEVTLQNEANTGKANEIVSLKAQLETQEQESAEKVDRIGTLGTLLIIEAERNVNKDKQIASLQERLKQETQASSNKGVMITRLRSDYAELDESWRAASDEVVDRSLELEKKIQEQKKLLNGELSEKDEMIEKTQRESKEEITALEKKCMEQDVTITRDKERLRGCYRALKDMEKAAVVTRQHHLELHKESEQSNQYLRTSIDKLKDQRSTAEAIAEQRKEEHDKLVATLKSKNESVKCLQADIKQLEEQRSAARALADQTKQEHDQTIARKDRLIANHEAEISAWSLEFEYMEEKKRQVRKEHDKTTASKDRSIDQLRGEVGQQKRAIEVMKLEQKSLRKRWDATKWEEEAEDSDVASVDSYDTDDDFDSKSSISKDLEDVQSYEDVQAEYESDVDEEEEKSDGVDNDEYVDVAEFSDDQDETCWSEDLEEEGENDIEKEEEKIDRELGVISEGSARDDSATDAESFTNIAEDF